MKPLKLKLSKNTTLNEMIQQLTKNKATEILRILPKNLFFIIDYNT